MEKDAFYFPHDSNAKDDPKCVMLIDQLGLEGYGIYWVLVETLRDQPSYKYPLALIPALAKRFGTSSEKVKAVVNSYQLFQSDDTNFWSPSLLRRMEIIDGKREQARNAAILRWHSVSNAPALLPQSVSNASKVKESKGKERKGKEIKEKDKGVYGEFKNVFLSGNEIEKLKERFNGEHLRRIEALSEYMQSKGVSYKDHYATILSWARKEENNGGNHNGDGINQRDIKKIPGNKPAGAFDGL